MRTSTVKSRTARPSVRPLTVSPISSLGAGRPVRCDTTSRPTMLRTRPAASNSAAGALRTTAPSRSTVMRSATASTSSM
ncbi:hypothetical protein ACFWP5_42920 [Streptomyces sp. NPDC058469]|uniref:hypothetical protein n=1 Tax=Streptomyces sp. NPDC058469 TaxID=3346514 RepID=UPI00364FD969